MEKRQDIRDCWSYSIMVLGPSGHYSILRDKKNYFGVDVVKFTCATRVL